MLESIFGTPIIEKILFYMNPLFVKDQDVMESHYD